MSSAHHLSLKQLRAFAAVYRLRRLAPAAAQLSITPSAVSVLIRQCEAALHSTLFDRSARQLEPTAAAHEAIGTVERILQDVAQLGAGARGQRSLRSERVRLAVTPAVASALLPDTVRRFITEHPQVRLELDDCAPDQFVARILDEQAEFGIGTPERLNPEIELHTLVQDRLCLVCPDDHPLARRKRVRWADLKDVPLIAVRPGYGVRRMIDDTAARAGVPLSISNEVAFVTSALWMTSAGLGVSIWPSALLRNAPQANLVVCPLVAPMVSRSISVVSKRGRGLSPACQAFVQMLVEDLAAHPAA
jgi:DNA-binding transcriptional LysR family regulator